MLGELNSPFNVHAKSDTSLSIDEYIEDWQNNKTVAHAGDLISAAVVNGLENNEKVFEAANFILSNSESTTAIQRSLANKIISSSVGKRTLFKLDSIGSEDFSGYINPKLIWEKIKLLRKAAREFAYNPIIWVELSRHYSILGLKDQSIKTMKIALHLAPENRFVLRCATRLFAHYNDLEYSHDLLRKNRLTSFDPWLTSAEIALATLRDRTSRFMQKGASMINSKNFSPFSLTELESSIGTVELINGSTKKSRILFNKSLIDPNDNSLAQAEWASKKDKQIVVNPSIFTVQHNFEAKALDDFQNENFSDALDNSVRWFLDMPFLKRPVMLGSHIASALLDDQEKSREFLKAGLISHPNDPQLINNIVYSLALENKTDEAMDYLEKITAGTSMEKTTEVCLTATRGLIYFRTGFADIGRQLYQNAIEDAKDIESEYFNWLAILNYAREELLLKSEYVDSVMEAVVKIPDEKSGADIKKLKMKVLEMHKKNKETAV